MKVSGAREPPPPPTPCGADIRSVQPENRHVKFNVDVKMQNDPPRLFNLMHQTISSYDNWQTTLAPRILLGIWHPRFLPHAEKILPYCRRSHIGMSPTLAKKFFWDSCEVFSMSFASLATTSGLRYVPSRNMDLRFFFTCLISRSVRIGSGRAARQPVRRSWSGL